MPNVGIRLTIEAQRMRHEAAYERRASLWEDLGIGVAVFAMAGAVVIGIGLWSHYVTGVFFVLGTAILAWHSGFRPALRHHRRSAPLAHRHRSSPPSTPTQRSVNLPVRVVSIGDRLAAWCRGCAATCIDRASGC